VPLRLDLIQTVALAGVAVMLGHGLRRALPVLARYDLPAPVLGGLAIALPLAVARAPGTELLAFDTTLQTPLMVAFFTTIGFGASVRLLRVGGVQVALFLVIAAGWALVQNLIGAGLAAAMGLPPLLGVLAGSVTLTGGPATGLAFAPLFEQAGVAGAGVAAVAAAMAGIVAGGILGGPLGGRLIARRRLRPAPSAVRVHDPAAPVPLPTGFDAGALLRAVVLILVAMWLGGYVARGFAALGLTLPAYIGAMLVAAALRNLDDARGVLRLPGQAVEDLGFVALSLFIAMALMTLPLGELARLALPLAALVAAQAAALGLACLAVFALMGRDYEAAVMSGGFYGFMMGTTANAMANMQTLTDRYGPAPRAFLVVPLVGAFFIDFVNALLITGFLNVFG
jgi:glutamate:Na+ symporter, ESS family